ncbi:rubrerythrin [Candidatus Woesearchaeota archaeon]|nr:rubrerythrin [Candidatus Woesearchaeota archaeon]
MLHQLPVDFNKVKKENLDKEILRAGIIAELDAISFYEQMAALTENEKIKKILLDIAKEEKTHVGEFETLLKEIDPEYTKELEEGKKEVDELTK